MEKTLTKILIIGLLLISISAKSQVLPIVEAQVSLLPVTTITVTDVIMDTLSDPFYLIQQQVNLKVGLSIILQDTIQPSLINITLGTTSGGSELMTQSFTYDNLTPSSGLSYKRTGDYIVLGLGIHPNSGSAAYYVGVELEDVNGNKSTIITTNTLQ